jgi:hypothetical protein
LAFLIPLWKETLYKTIRRRSSRYVRPKLLMTAVTGSARSLTAVFLVDISPLSIIGEVEDLRQEWRIGL